MVNLAAGDSVTYTPDGTRCTVVSVSSPNATVSVDNGTKANFTTAIANLFYNGIVGKGGGNAYNPTPVPPTVYAAAVVNPVLSPYDSFAIFNSATTTGFITRSNVAPGQVLRVKNATGADFITGDFNVKNGHTWEFIFDGTNWNQILTA